nr:hypothetical protein GCM10025732_33110 [Glycomyces mayteni]
MNMAAQRDKLVNALGAVVSNVDTIDAVVPTLQALGRDHRKFGALRGHYPAVGEALLATLEHFSGAHWTPAIAADWAAAYELVAATMADAADAAAHYTPAWWDAEVVGHERRDLETAIITIAPGTRLDFTPGQSVSLCTSLRPRAWRTYSPPTRRAATAPSSSTSGPWTAARSPPRSSRCSGPATRCGSDRPSGPGSPCGRARARSP